MALIQVKDLNNSAKRAKSRNEKYNTSTLQKVLNESFRSKSFDEEFDIFLSHSFLDSDIVLGLMNMIEEKGFSVYLDWVEDSHLDRASVTRETANHIRLRMEQSKSLLYAFSQNSNRSKWMPWELGYFDGKIGRVAICPVTEEKAVSYSGREYLSLYPYISIEPPKGKIEPIMWVNEKPDIYVSFQKWLKGNDPYKH